MSAHSHAHNDADKHTNFGTVAEFLSSFVGDAYWLGSLVDKLWPHSPLFFVRLHRNGFASGVAITLLSASGAAYCHRILNKLHQPSSTLSTTTTKPTVLSKQKKALYALTLFGDTISHLNDAMAPIMLVADLINPAFSLYLVALASATVIAGLSSVANVRTCYQALLKHHVGCTKPSEAEAPKKDVDHWTNIATLGEAVCNFIGNAYWMGTLWDQIARKPVQIIGLSYPALGFGTSLAFFSAMGSAYCHRILNHQHQSEENTAHAHEGNQHNEKYTHLSKWDWLAFTGDIIFHINDILSPIMLSAMLATNEVFNPLNTYFILLGSALVFSTAGSIANIRTCYGALLKNTQSREQTQPLLTGSINAV